MSPTVHLYDLLLNQCKLLVVVNHEQPAEICLKLVA